MLTRLTTANCKDHLEKCILSFWMKQMVDEEQGGFYGRMDGNNILIRDAPKGIILNTRILWTFSAAYGQIKKRLYINTAVRAYEYLVRHFFDEQHGGVFWMVDAKGHSLDTKKQIYAQAFAIYALAEFYKITADEEALKKAIVLFGLIEQHSFDQVGNGYLEAFDNNWKLLGDLRLSEKDANEAKTMNTHLHILEAYTNLYQVWPNKFLKHQLINLIELFLERWIDETGHFRRFFDIAWNLRSKYHSYGHDIEGGWLLVKAAETAGSKDLILRCKDAALRLTDGALEGLDEDGGLMNEGDSNGVTDFDKHWWPQAEALVGLQNAFLISGDKSYFSQAGKVWEFIQQRLVDSSHGEWHWMITKAGEINRNEDKAGLWKCPYHNGRAMLELMNRLRIK